MPLAVVIACLLGTQRSEGPCVLRVFFFFDSTVLVSLRSPYITQLRDQLKGVKMLRVVVVSGYCSLWFQIRISRKGYKNFIVMWI